MKNNKGLTLVALIVTIIILLIISFLTLAVIIPWNDMKNTSININTNEQIECEHEWVVTSEYNFWLNKYKTISKCSKCGKIIN